MDNERRAALVDKVAVAIMTATAGPTFGDTKRNMAAAAIDIALEEAAQMAASYPAATHGNMAIDPHAAAAQAAQEIAAAILTMKGDTNGR